MAVRDGTEPAVRTIEGEEKRKRKPLPHAMAKRALALGKSGWLRGVVVTGSARQAPVAFRGESMSLWHT